MASIPGHTINGILGAAVAVVPGDAGISAAHLASSSPVVQPAGSAVAQADLLTIAGHLQLPNGAVGPTAAALQKRVDVAILCAQLIATVLP